MKNWLFLLVVLMMLGCNGNVQARYPYVVNPPQAGNPQRFDVHIYNNSQWELDLGIGTLTATGQTGHIILPVGDYFIYHVGFLPSSVTIQAVTTAIPPYVFPIQSQSLYANYGPNDEDISFGFPF